MKNFLLCVFAIGLLLLIAFLCAIIVSHTGMAQIMAILFTILVTIIWIFLIFDIVEQIRNMEK